MLKGRSLSTDDVREHSILFATFPISEIMLRLIFHHLRGSTSHDSSGRQKNLSNSLFRVNVDDDLRAFFFFEVCFSTFCTADVSSDDKSSKQESESYMLTDASPEPRFISFGFSTFGTDINMQRQDLVKKILKADAVPTVFSQLPSYSTKKKPLERSQMTGNSTRLEADNSRLQLANDQVLKVGHIKTLDELQLKMEGEIVSEEIHKISYQERLVYAYFSFDKQVGLRTVFSLIVSQDLSFDIYLGGKVLLSLAVSHLVTSGKITDTCVLDNMLAFMKEQSENVPEQRFQIDDLVDSLAVAIEEDHAGRENHRTTTLPHRAAETGNDLTLWFPVLSQSSSLRSSVGELEPVTVQADAQRKCLVSTFYPLPAQPVKDLLHGHRTNWEHPLLRGCENQAHFRTRAACSPPHQRDLYRPASGVPVRNAGYKPIND